jgi:hypothetical protein
MTSILEASFIDILFVSFKYDVHKNDTDTEIDEPIEFHCCTQSNDRLYLMILTDSIDDHDVVLVVYGGDMSRFDRHFRSGDCRGDRDTTFCLIGFVCFLASLLLFLYFFECFFDSITNTGLTSLQELRHLPLGLQLLLSKPFINRL